MTRPVTSLALNSETENVCSILDASNLVRTISVGSAWTRLRIMMRYRYEGTYADFKADPGTRLYVGLLAGQGSAASIASANHFCGIRTYASGHGHGANRRGYYVRSSIIVGGSETTATHGPTTNTTSHFAFPMFSYRRYYLGLEIDKSTTPWTVTTLWQNAAEANAGASECTISRFKSTVLGTDPWPAHGSGADNLRYVSTPFTPNEALNGYFDTVIVQFNDSGGKSLYVSDLVAQVMD